MLLLLVGYGWGAIYIIPLPVVAAVLLDMLALLSRFRHTRTRAAVYLGIGAMDIASTALGMLGTTGRLAIEDITLGELNPLLRSASETQFPEVAVASVLLLKLALHATGAYAAELAKRDPSSEAWMVHLLSVSGKLKPRSKRSTVASFVAPFKAWIDPLRRFTEADRFYVFAVARWAGDAVHVLVAGVVCANLIAALVRVPAARVIQVVIWFASGFLAWIWWVIRRRHWEARLSPKAGGIYSTTEVRKSLDTFNATQPVGTVGDGGIIRYK